MYDLFSALSKRFETEDEVWSDLINVIEIVDYIILRIRNT